MKSIFIIIFVLVLSHFKAQDTLYFKNSTKQAILLIEVNPDNVKYKRFDNQKGATYTVLKSDVTYVRFKNGTKEVFEEPKAIVQNTVTAVDTAKVPEPIKEKDNNIFAGDKPDTLYFRSGKKTEAKVLIINDKEVRYKLFSYQDGPTYQAAKYELKQVSYGNGNVEQFSEIKPAENENPGAVTSNPNSNPDVYSNPKSVGGSSQGMYQKGKTDALKHYKHKGAAITTGCTTAFPYCGPLGGLIPAVIATNNEPSYKNLNIPPSAYANNSDYLRGYSEMANKMKKKNVWTGYAIGGGVYAVIMLAVLLFAYGVI